MAKYNIWCYWSQGVDNLPRFHRSCIKSFEKHLKSKKFKINIISKRNFLNLQDEFDLHFLNQLTFQQQSDIVRLKLLEMHGGIWIDITSIITSSLDSLVIDHFESNTNITFIGFDINYGFSQRNVLENWFIAVKHKNHYMITCWKRIFIQIMNEKIQYGSVEKSPLWQDTNKEGIPFYFRSYLSMHVAHLHCLHNNITYSRMYVNNCIIYDAAKTALVGVNGDGFINRIGSNANFPLIKLRGNDVKYWCYFLPSHRLYEIIAQNTGKTYGINPYVFDIIFYTMIGIFTHFYFNRRSSS